MPPVVLIPHGTPSLLSPIIPNQGVMCSDVRNAQKQRLTIVGKNDTFLEAVSLLAALHLANKCKSKGEKHRSGCCVVSTTIGTTTPINSHLHEHTIQV
jgi:hypothetical protein